MTKTKSHKCEFCNKLFPSANNLRLHLNIHNKLKPFACSTCQKSFASPGTRGNTSSGIVDRNCTSVGFVKNHYLHRLAGKGTRKFTQAQILCSSVRFVERSFGRHLLCIPISQFILDLKHFLVGFAERIFARAPN